MRIIGKCVEDLGFGESTKLYKGPYPVGHPDLSEIDESKAYGDYHSDYKHSDLLELLRGDGDSHYLSKFVVSNHSHPSGIKDFDATFTTSDGKKITKEYQMEEMPPNQIFLQEFAIDLDNVALTCFL
ncbi:hypothetical protein ADUPG1_008452 [Aduncisulcus paluster]|uniref:Uncharacterized protein n=1 Tax=Aduncisulcus paluster TaxID=2918883 RepID=A0ABQ5KV00_9EUKA|nr:hypothetical protein ADUPG1_008452 [Aduncisulcus paluster]